MASNRILLPPNPLAEASAKWRALHAGTFKGMFSDGPDSALSLISDLGGCGLVGYEKILDKSSNVTDVAGLTYTAKKAYKHGNVVTLSIMAQNKTGSSIANGTTLFALGSDITPLVGVLNAYANNTACVLGVSSDGTCNCSVAIPDNQFVFANISYAVA